MQRVRRHRGRRLREDLHLLRLHLRNPSSAVVVHRLRRVAAPEAARGPGATSWTRIPQVPTAWGSPNCDVSINPGRTLAEAAERHMTPVEVRPEYFASKGISWRLRRCWATLSRSLAAITATEAPGPVSARNPALRAFGRATLRGERARRNPGGYAWLTSEEEREGHGPGQLARGAPVGATRSRAYLGGLLREGQVDAARSLYAQKSDRLRSGEKISVGS